MFEGWLGDGADDVHDSEVGCGSGGCGSGLGVEDLEGADGGEDGRDAKIVAEEGGGGVYLGYVAQDAGAEGDAVEGQPVAAHGGLGFGRAYEVVPGSLGKVLAGALDDFFVAEELGCQVWSPELLVLVGGIYWHL